MLFIRARPINSTEVARRWEGNALFGTQWSTSVFINHEKPADPKSSSTPCSIAEGHFVDGSDFVGTPVHSVSGCSVRKVGELLYKAVRKNMSLTIKKHVPTWGWWKRLRNQSVNPPRPPPARSRHILSAAVSLIQFKGFLSFPCGYMYCM